MAFRQCGGISYLHAADDGDRRFYFDKMVEKGGATTIIDYYDVQLKMKQ